MSRKISLSDLASYLEDIETAIEQLRSVSEISSLRARLVLEDGLEVIVEVEDSRTASIEIVTEKTS